MAAVPGPITFHARKCNDRMKRLRYQFRSCGSSWEARGIKGIPKQQRDQIQPGGARSDSPATPGLQQQRPRKSTAPQPSPSQQRWEAKLEPFPFCDKPHGSTVKEANKWRTESCGGCSPLQYLWLSSELARQMAAHNRTKQTQVLAKNGWSNKAAFCARIQSHR